MLASLAEGKKAEWPLKTYAFKSNFLLLDEPTNHLDISSKEALEDAVLGYDGTLLAISHDRYFLNRVCTKIFELQPDGMKIYYGNYNYYKEKSNKPSFKIQNKKKSHKRQRLSFETKENVKRKLQQRPVS